MSLILYTGFKGKNNSSCQLLQLIKGDKLFLTNSLEGVRRDIGQHEGQYDCSVMLGLDKTLKNEVRIDCAAEYEGVLYHTKLDAASVKELLDLEGVTCKISFTPTRYLCNAAYWHMLRKNHGKAIFIHIPTNKNMAGEMCGKLAKCLEKLEI